MRARIFRIPGPWSGRLGIVPRPRGGDWLEDEVGSWRESGLDVVVSLLMPGETSELELDQEAAWCARHGIRFLSFPIPDRDVPDSRRAVLDLARDLDRALNEGRNVAVHCRQGIGRSGTIAAILLIRAGEDPGTAWEHVREGRGCPVPDTEEQREWVGVLASTAPDLLRDLGHSEAA